MLPFSPCPTRFVSPLGPQTNSGGRLPGTGPLSVRNIRTIGILGAVISLILLPAPGHAQTGGKRLIILPFAHSVTDSALSSQMYEAFVSGIRTLPGIFLASAEETHRLLGTQPVSAVIASPERLHQFVGSASASLIVAGVVHLGTDGAVEMTVLIYSWEERRVRDLIQRRFESPLQAVSEAGAVGEAISRRRNLTRTDTPLFQSILLPGSGQISMGEPRRGLLAAGLVSGALIYGLTTPQPDKFHPDYLQYSIREGTYYYRGQVVTSEEYYDALYADMDRQELAEAQRQAVEARRRRAVTFFLGAYLFNLVDTILLSRRQVDAAPLYLHLESVRNEFQPEVRARGLRVHLTWRLP